MLIVITVVARPIKSWQLILRHCAFPLLDLDVEEMEDSDPRIAK